VIKILGIEATRQVEAAADAAGYSYAAMMESAGQAVAERALALIADRPQPKITILVGSGNNGGDGLVAGRLIAQANPQIQVRFYLLTRREESDAMFAAALEAGLFMAYAEDDHDNRVLRNMVASADVIIDALFGIRARLPIKDAALKILRGAKQALDERAAVQRNHFMSIDPTAPGQVEHPPKQYILAVDCPSGLNCDTGEIDKNALGADETITFIAAKPGLLTFPGAAAVGRLRVAPLEMPEGIEVLEKASSILLDGDTVQHLLPARPADAHKGTFGKVMIVAGSINYTGAPALAAKGVYRSGAGLVTVGAPAPVIGSLSAHILEATWLLLAHDLGVLTEPAASTIREELKNCKALLIGPGLGQEETTRNMLRALLAPKVAQAKRTIGFGLSSEEDKTKSDDTSLPPLVIDADGLNLLSQLENWWTLLPKNTILTPHPGEMARLCGTETTEVQSKRLELAKSKAKAWKVVLILKGANTIIAAPDGKLAYSPFKTDALATAGTGDVLAGLTAGLLAQGLTAFDAAQVAVYLHGLAGVLSAEKSATGRSVIASDVLDALPAAFATISTH
jgi:NAD(P)H-hydrate epimerase